MSERWNFLTEALLLKEMRSSKFQRIPFLNSGGKLGILARA
jgi:hypothetical protein